MRRFSTKSKRFMELQKKQNNKVKISPEEGGIFVVQGIDKYYII